jgi:hypothetical protein
MKTNRAIILVFAIAAIVAVATLPCPAAQNDDKSIFTEGDERGPGPRPGFGPGRGPGREGPGRGRFDLTDEEVDHIMEGLRERSPEKAKELEGLRDTDPEKFNAELRRHAREEFGKVIREKIEKWQNQRQADFLEWLTKNVPEESEELAKLKERSPNLYGEKYELVQKKYGRVYEEGRRNPELEKVLIEDLRLQKRRDQLLAKINATDGRREKQKLIEELEEVVGHRYDLIVRRKQIAYERLLKWLEELQNRIKESRADIIKAQNAEVKVENVKTRTKELLEQKKGFNWN